MRQSRFVLEPCPEQPLNIGELAERIDIQYLFGILMFQYRFDGLEQLEEFALFKGIRSLHIRGTKRWT